MRFTVIDHDDLDESLPRILDSLGYDDCEDLADEIYDEVVAYMKETGNENVIDVVKIIISESYLVIDSDDEDEEVLVTIVED